LYIDLYDGAAMLFAEGNTVQMRQYAGGALLSPLLHAKIPTDRGLSFTFAVASGDKMYLSPYNLICAVLPWFRRSVFKMTSLQFKYVAVRLKWSEEWLKTAARYLCRF